MLPLKKLLPEDPSQRQKFNIRYISLITRNENPLRRNCGNIWTRVEKCHIVFRNIKKSLLLKFSIVHRYIIWVDLKI